MKAIETSYKGYKFRSRLEARYAVFFDAMGIKWRYEIEGFVLPSGEYYLPDFWLPEFNGGMWVEVKAEEFTEEEKAKCYELCFGSKKNVWLANDTPDLTCYEVFYWVDEPPYVMEGDGIPNADEAEGGNRMFAMSGYGQVGKTINPEYLNFMGEQLPAAIKAAKEARFEHGEIPG